MVAVSDQAKANQRAYRARWWATNQEKARAYRVAFHAKHGQARNATRAANPWRKAIDALNRSRRTARRFGLAPGSLTKEVFARLHLLPCAYCGTMPAMGVDHVTPFARGGVNEMDNLVSACLSCNKSKNARLLQVWPVLVGTFT